MPLSQVPDFCVAEAGPTQGAFARIHVDYAEENGPRQRGIDRPTLRTRGSAAPIVVFDVAMTRAKERHIATRRGVYGFGRSLAATWESTVVAVAQVLHARTMKDHRKRRRTTAMYAG